MNQRQSSSSYTQQHHPQYISKHMTNNIIVFKSSLQINQKKQILKNSQQNKCNNQYFFHLYYLPAYLKVNVKKLTDLVFSTSTGKINAQIDLTIYYGDLFENHIVNQNQNDPNQSPQKLLVKELFLVPNDDQPIQISKLNSDVKINHRKKQIKAHIKKQITTKLNYNVFFTPFQIVKQILTFRIKNVKLLFQNKQYHIRFNFMDTSNKFQKLSFGYQGDYQDYQIAQKLIQVQYSQYSIPKEQRQNIKAKRQYKEKKSNKYFYKKNNHDEQEKQLVKSQYVQKIQKPNSFNYAHFTIPLYKYPVATLGTIFVPLWILNILNVGIFFSAPDFSQRLSSVAALMIAYVALIPTVRERIPKSSELTFVQILVYIQAFVSLITIIQGLDRNDEPQKEFIWYEDPYFIVVISIVFFSFISIVILFIIHKCYWEPNYNEILPQISRKFYRKQWFNVQCDKAFEYFEDQIQILRDIPQLTNFGDKILQYGKTISKEIKNKQRQNNSDLKQLLINEK